MKVKTLDSKKGRNLGSPELMIGFGNAPGSAPNFGVKLLLQSLNFAIKSSELGI